MSNVALVKGDFHTCDDVLEKVAAAAKRGDWWCYWRAPDGREYAGVGVRHRHGVEDGARIPLDATKLPEESDFGFLTLAFDGVEPAGPWGATPPYQHVVPKRLFTSVASRSVPTPPAVELAVKEHGYPARVEGALRAIRAGLVDKVVVAREERFGPANPIETLRILRGSFPTCRIFGVPLGDGVFLGASPEPLFTLQRDEVHTSALAGTSATGDDALLHSEKDLREHAWVVDAIRDALRPLCDELTIADSPELLRLPNVQHLHTAVAGKLREGVRPTEVLARMHPTPAVCGHKREEAARLITEVEDFDRGLYAGVVGWLGSDEAELAVAIRSALLLSTETRLYAGAGIVRGSDPQAEHLETIAKLQAMGRWMRWR